VRGVVPQVRPAMVDQKCLKVERNVGSKDLLEFWEIQKFLQMHLLLYAVLIELRGDDAILRENLTEGILDLGHQQVGGDQQVSGSPA
jgi:hypothetical protein